MCIIKFKQIAIHSFNVSFDNPIIAFTQNEYETVKKKKVMSVSKRT